MPSDRTPDASGPIIYVIDSTEHPLDVASLATGRRSRIASVPVDNWNDALSPWPAEGFRPGAPGFAGHGDQALDRLLHDLIPTYEAARGLTPSSRAICGYSLAGLFALYAFVRAALSVGEKGVRFQACAALSASLWYPGWVDYLSASTVDLTGTYVYLSVGRKERRGGPKIVRGVEDAMAASADLLRARNAEADFTVGPGSHIQYQLERFDAGISALDAFLSP